MTTRMAPPATPNSSEPVDPLGEDWVSAPLPEPPEWVVAPPDVLPGWDDRGDEARLDGMAPGPELAGLLAQVSLAGTDDGSVVAAAAAAARLQSWAASRELAAIAELHGRVQSWPGVGPTGSLDGVDRDQVSPELMTASEVGAALALSPGAARNRVALAKGLARLPATRAALAAGLIDLVKARDIVDALSILDDDTAREVEQRVIARAQGRTAAQLRQILRRAVIAVDPAAAQARHEKQKAARGVRREWLDDGMGHLDYTDAAENIEALYQWITATALAAKAAAARAGVTDPRTLDQLRADVLADLGRDGLTDGDLLVGRPVADAGDAAEAADGDDVAAEPAEPSATSAEPDETTPDDTTPGDSTTDGAAQSPGAALTRRPLPTRQGRHPQIGVVIDWSTLAGLNDDPAELVGVGPITAGAARLIAADGTWRRFVTDPRTGRLAEMSTGRYEPTQQIRDAVIARDPYCRGPGCRVSGDRCDLDHRVPHPIGRTEPGNLDPGCRPWHRVKTHTDTTIEIDDDDGLWIRLPSGRVYHYPAEPLLDRWKPANDVDPPDPPVTPAPPAPDDDVPPF